MNPVPDRIQGKLDALRDDARLDPAILVLLEKVVNLVVASGRSDLLDDCFIGLLDCECVTMDWTSRNVFCSIFSDSLEVDRAEVRNGMARHRIVAMKPQQIDERFISSLGF